MLGGITDTDINAEQLNKIHDSVKVAHHEKKKKKNKQEETVEKKET